MDELVLEEVATGQRKFTEEEREAARSQHDFLFEYVGTQNRDARDALSDQDLAKEVQHASLDYVRCTM